MSDGQLPSQETQSIESFSLFFCSKGMLSSVWGITWLSATMCHLAKCRPEEIEICEGTCTGEWRSPVQVPPSTWLSARTGHSSKYMSNIPDCYGNNDILADQVNRISLKGALNTLWNWITITFLLTLWFSLKGSSPTSKAMTVISTWNILTVIALCG